MSKASQDAYYALVQAPEGEGPDWNRFRDPMIQAEGSQLDNVLVSSLPVRERAELLTITMETVLVLRFDEFNVDRGELYRSRTEFEDAVRTELVVKRPLGYKSQLAPLSLRQTQRFFKKEARKAKRREKCEAKNGSREA